MAFSETLKLEVKRKAHFTCCLCKSLGVEIHHIIPQAENGPDTEENAAPLCPSCHEIYGANPVKRKFIREVRDHWYEICARRYAGDPNILAEIRKTLSDVATKEDINRLAIKNANYTPTPGRVNLLLWQHLKYSFEREDYVHPLIIRELVGWISDVGESITAVDLGLADRSNRFHGQFSAESRDGRVWIKWAGQGSEFFEYSFVASSSSGVQIIECYEGEGGSGVFGSVCLLSFENDICLSYDTKPNLSGRNRLILKILGKISLGDRYEGMIHYTDGRLIIGPDVGWFARGEDACAELAIE